MSLYGLDSNSLRYFHQLLFRFDTTGKADIDDLFAHLVPERALPPRAERNDSSMKAAVSSLLRDIEDGKVSLRLHGEPDARKVAVKGLSGIVLEPLPVGEKPARSGLRQFFVSRLNAVNETWFSDEMSQQNEYQLRESLNAAYAAGPDNNSREFLQFEHDRKLSEALSFYSKKDGFRDFCSTFYDYGRNCPSPTLLISLLARSDSDGTAERNARFTLAQRIFNGMPLTDRERNPIISEIKRMQKTETDEYTRWETEKSYGALLTTADYLTVTDKTDNAFLNAGTMYEHLYRHTMENSTAKEFITPSKRDAALIKGTLAFERCVCNGKEAEEYIINHAEMPGIDRQAYNDALASVMLAKACVKFMNDAKKSIDRSSPLTEKAYEPNFVQKLFGHSEMTVETAKDALRKTEGFSQLSALPPQEVAGRLRGNGRSISAAVNSAVSHLLDLASNDPKAKKQPSEKASEKKRRLSKEPPTLTGPSI